MIEIDLWHKIITERYELERWLNMKQKFVNKIQIVMFFCVNCMKKNFWEMQDPTPCHLHELNFHDKNNERLPLC